MIKEKLNKLKEHKVALVGMGSLACSTLVSTTCFAAETGSVADSISSALGTIKTDVLSAIGVIAPIGIAIFGAYFVWKKGLAFFRGIAK